MEDRRKIFNELNDINLLILTNSTNEFIFPARPDLSWIRNSACLQTGEICSSMLLKRL